MPHVSMFGFYTLIMFVLKVTLNEASNIEGMNQALQHLALFVKSACQNPLAVLEEDMKHKSNRL